jgi:predicted HicB family RNase H-like nuclease
MRLSELHRNYASTGTRAFCARVTVFEQHWCYRRKCKHCKHIHAALDLTANFWEIAARGGCNERLIPAFKTRLEGANFMEMVVDTPVDHENRRQTAQRIAAEMFQQQPDWITFFREVLGVDGLLRKLFQSAEELAAFEKTEEYNEIQLMLAKLRERNGQADGKEPTRVITVRLPKSLHDSLRAEAHDRKTSMNQLCISKLLQVIEADMMPAE